MEGIMEELQQVAYANGQLAILNAIATWLEKAVTTNPTDESINTRALLEELKRLRATIEELKLLRATILPL